MKKKFFGIRAQSTTEYAVLIGIIAAALVAMQCYVKRGIQGRIRDLADQISTQHYEAKGTASYYNTTQTGTTVQEYSAGIVRVYQDGSDPKGESKADVITRSGYEVVNPEE